MLRPFTTSGDPGTSLRNTRHGFDLFIGLQIHTDEQNVLESMFKVVTGGKNGTTGCFVRGTTVVFLDGVKSFDVTL